MAEEREETVAENLKEGFISVEHYVEQNPKTVMIGGGVIALVVIAIIFVFVKWLPDENLKAQKTMYMAEFAFAKDSFALALNGTAGFNGSASYKGFAEVADKYSLTKAGNLANYYAGICCLNLKQYDKAIKYLDKFSTSDAIIGALKLNAMGDAYAELGKMDDAVKYYEKAAGYSDNQSYTPYFLLKSGQAFEKQKKYGEAKKQYEAIRDKYPTSEEGRDIEKYIARAAAGAN